MTCPICAAGSILIEHVLSHTESSTRCDICDTPTSRTPRRGLSLCNDCAKVIR